MVTPLERVTIDYNGQTEELIPGVSWLVASHEIVMTLYPEVSTPGRRRNRTVIRRVAGSSPARGAHLQSQIDRGGRRLGEIVALPGLPGSEYGRVDTVVAERSCRDRLCPVMVDAAREVDVPFARGGLGVAEDRGHLERAKAWSPGRRGMVGQTTPPGFTSAASLAPPPVTVRPDGRTGHHGALLTAVPSAGHESGMLTIG
jgi:hypothetical protein